MYVIGGIETYIASYFNVEVESTQLILPSLFVINGAMFPLGSQLVQKYNPKM